MGLVIVLFSAYVTFRGMMVKALFDPSPDPTGLLEVVYSASSFLEFRHSSFEIRSSVVRSTDKPQSNNKKSRLEKM